MWYVIQVKTGSEARIRDQMKESGIPAYVPIEDRPIRKEGTWVKKEYVIFPSYVFLQMEYTAENYYKVRKIPNVIRFLGCGSQPTPLSYPEAEWIRTLSAGENGVLEPSKIREKENGEIQIIEGILKNFANQEIRYNRHSRRASFEITICNEPRKVQLGVEYITEKEPEHED